MIHLPEKAVSTPARLINFKETALLRSWVPESQGSKLDNSQKEAVAYRICYNK